MKTVLRIMAVTAAALLFLLALAFAVIEARLLISGDWLLHEIPLLAFLQYFCRFALAAAAGYTAVRCIVKKKRS